MSVYVCCQECGESYGSHTGHETLEAAEQALRQHQQEFGHGEA